MSVIGNFIALFDVGFALWGLCQGREALRAAHYSDSTIKSFEQQSGILHMWGVEDPQLIQDIELWSGKASVAIRGVNNAGGTVASASFGISEQARPLLQPEDIRAIDDGRQIIRVRGSPLYVANRVPWFMVPRWQQLIRDVRDLHHIRSAKAVVTTELAGGCDNGQT